MVDLHHESGTLARLRGGSRQREGRCGVGMRTSSPVRMSAGSVIHGLIRSTRSYETR